MRPLPLMMALLVGATGLALGYWVLSTTSPGGAPAGGPGATPRALPQGHVYAGVTSEPGDVNPFTAHSNVARRFVLGLTHEGLVDTDPVTGALRPALAESWQLSEDGMACTFTLREGVRFSDGSPVTMTDVLFGWELAKAGHVPFGFVGDAFGRVRDARALDARRLQIDFAEPYYASVRAVGERWLVANRAFFVGRIAAMCRRLDQPVPATDTSEFAALLGQIDRECGPGTGPFVLPSDAEGPSTWRPRQDLSLVPSAHHWRRTSMPETWNLGGVRLLFRTGPARVNALIQREVDWLGGWVAPSFYASRAELAEDFRLLTYDYETLGVLGVLWNCDKPALADPGVRRALALLIDVAAITKKFPAATEPAFAFAKPGSPGYPRIDPKIAFDPAAARRLLREAGYDPDQGRPLSLSILAVPDGGPMDLAVGLLADAARGAGIELAVESLPFPAYVARKTQDQWDGIVVNRSFRPWGDPFDFVHSAGLDNDGHWQHVEADRLAVAARRELDEDKRAALWRELHELVYREQPFTFLVHPRACVIFNRHIERAEPGPRGLWPERWWVAEEHQRK